MKKTLAQINDERVQRALQKGLHTDASQQSPEIVRRPIRPSTEKQYEDELRLWDAYKLTWPSHEPTNMQHLKHYVDFLITSTIPKLGEEPDQDSIRGKVRRFCNAWERKYNSTIPSSIKESMAPFIIMRLPRPSGKKRKKYFTFDNYTVMQTFHWTEDCHNYRHEGMRADYTNLLNLHCYTSARQQEICQAVYKDIELMLGWKNDKPEFRFKLTREICKGTDTDQPEHSFGEEITDEEGNYPPLFAQPMFHMLANMISARVYPELSTVEEALKLKPPKNMSRVIPLADKCENKPVFPAWSSGGPQAGRKNPRSWGTQASDWAIRAGLAKGLGLHSVRREALIQANDKGYTLGQVLRFASQHNPSVLFNSYLGNMSTIDGTANYLRMEHRTDLTDGFRSNTMSYNPGLIQSLPPEDQKRLESSPEYQSTNNSIAGIKLSLKEPASKDEKKDLRRQLKGYQNVLRAFRRKKLRELQICQKVNYEPMESLDDQWDERRSKFNRFKHMLSDERIRLAKIITEPVSPRSDKWVSALKDLVVLRTTSSPVAFQEVLRPIDGRCPVHSCQKRMAEIRLPTQWKHVYECYKKEYTDKFGFVQFCFLCSLWETSEERWETHCQHHINNHDVPFRCDPFTYRYGTACAGYCPVHLGDASLAAHERLQQFISHHHWEFHISNCLEQYVTTVANDMETFNCPHYRCTIICSSKEDLFDHLSKIHKISTNSKWVQSSNSQDIKKRKLSTCGTIFKTTTQDDFSQQSISTAKNSDDYDTMELMTQSSKSFQSDEDVPMVDSSLLVAPLDDPKTDLKDIPVDPDLHIESDALTAEAFKKHIDDTSSRESSLPDDAYVAQCLLAEYKYGRTMLYRVKWNEGSTTWVPKESILDQNLITELKKGYKGFNSGIKVIKARTKSKKTQYRVQFLKYEGAPEDEFWWVDEGIMDPEAIKIFKTEEEGRKA